MMRTLLLIPTGPDVGLSTVALGVVRAVDAQGFRAGFYKPIAQYEVSATEEEHSTAMISGTTKIKSPKAIKLSRVTDFLSQNKLGDLLEELVSRYEPYKDQADIMVMEGLVPTKNQPYANKLNVELVKALDAKVILVARDDTNPALLRSELEITANNFGGLRSKKILGVIVNKVGITTMESELPLTRATVSGRRSNRDRACHYLKQMPSLANQISLLGAIPYDKNFIAPRVSDLATFLHAKLLNQGDYLTRRVKQISVCARSMENMVGALKAGTLVVTAGDRSDVILAAAMAVLNGVNLAGILLTGNYPLKKSVVKLCRNALKTGLPVLSVPDDSFATSVKLANLNVKIPVDDIERIEATTNKTARYIEHAWIKKLVASKFEQRMSPPAFRYQLITQAQHHNKRIVLPEGTEPRTIAAAAICSRRGIARCVLLGKRDEIKRMALNQDIELGPAIEIIEPRDIIDHYIEPMVELRKHKQLTSGMARDQLHDNVVLATMMLQQGDVDGLVSGAEHTTANTIRPALQLIKTAPAAKLVSSVFFMCLPDQVLIYGDCAVNTNPNAEELADIAIQSHDSAKAFGVEPRVAMISYSTGQSGMGQDVDKVRLATELVKQHRPDICVDGPLQYDAAFMESVAKKKAPDSPVAGKATVFVFPDLNTGNTTYKAVQRSANVVCIGPMLQGLNKPVNDLSRGALIDDIVFTIAITAIQAK